MVNMNQFKKTAEEKLAIKVAKSAFKRGDSPPAEKIERRPVAYYPSSIRPLMTGKIEGEFELEEDYPVRADFYYLARFKDDHYRVVKALFDGKVKDLKKDFNKPPFIKGTEYIVAILNCNLLKRNLL